MQLHGTETTWYLMGDPDAVADYARVDDGDTLTIRPSERAGAAVELFQDGAWEVVAGRAYCLVVPVRPSLSRAHGEIHLQWLDSQQKVIGQADGPFVFLEHDWAERVLWALAPADAVKARFLMRFSTDHADACGRLQVGRAKLLPSLVIEALPDDPVALYDRGQPIGYSINVRGAPKTLPVAELAVRVVDYEGQVVHEETVVVALMDGSGDAAWGLPQLPAGYYRLELAAEGEGLTPAHAQASLGCLDPLDYEPGRDYAIAIDAGMSWPFEPGRTSVDANFDEERLRVKCEACYRLGVRSLRDRLNWNHVNPEPGRFDWGVYAIAADAQARAGLDVYQVFHSTAAWATVPSQDGQVHTNLPPADPRDLYRMTRQLARDLGDRVSFFELWNEADIQFFSGYVWDYAAVTKAGYLGIKDERPEMGVLWGSRCQRTEFWAKALENGCAPYWDVFNQHSYGEPEDLWELHRQDRELMAELGLQRPIWMTEMGRRAVPDAQGSYLVGERDQVSYLLRSYGCGLMSGLERFYYFYLQEYLEAGVHLWGLMRADLSPYPSFLALATLIRQLGAARPLGYWQRDRTYCLLFDRGDGQTVGLAWSLDAGTPLAVDCDEGAYLVNAVGTRVRDLPAGKTTLRLTSQPVFVRGLRADALVTRPPSPRPCYAPDPTTPQEALHLWLQAVARPGEPYPPYAEVARQKLALETAPGRTEALALRVHNWTDQATSVELTLDLPVGWEADGWRGGGLLVPAGKTATVELTLRVGPLEAGIEASVGAELWQDGVRRDRVRVYYRTV